MGIFNFVKEAGSKVGLGESPSKKAAEAAKDEELHELREGNKLVRLIMDMDLGIESPKVKYDDGVATVSGVAPTQEAREKTILVIGNVAGVSSVDDRLQVTEAAPEAVFYTVQKGDTLGKIAKEQLGAASRYPEIFEANKPLLKDPNKIYPGQTLRIPQA
ncbi:MAG: peptidoglycan-binding protein LysM [Gemmatimonadota bacterium]|nr:peptidoglycan-binding protein LysM [Gemmatimonadota bacterium]MDH3424192.1 peptidoglycan-binding protein LysM [Gemmatimonadota bacterium]